MDFLKAQFTRIQEQLSGLTATQKMLVVSLLTIMVMTLLWWSHWAAEPEMSSLLDPRPFPRRHRPDFRQISMPRRIPHQVINNSIYVPADRKLEIMAVLGYSNALPEIFEDGFDSIVKEMNWLDPPDKTQEMFLPRQGADADIDHPAIARRLRCGGCHRRHRQSADIDDNDVQPVATVMLTTNRNNKMDSHRLAEVAADMVCGAKAGLQRSSVNVAIDGQSIRHPR